MAVTVFINYKLSKPKEGHTYIPLYSDLTNYELNCKFTDIITKFQSSLLLAMFEHLKASVPIFIRPTSN